MKGEIKTMLVPLSHLGYGKVIRRVISPPTHTLGQGDPGALSPSADLGQ